MKIEAVTVSINFSDYLKQCIPNKRVLDRWIIVTHESDKKTISVCKENKLEYICTKRIHENGSRFAKGKAINDGLKKIDRDDWLLQLDSDILLPDNFREIINESVNNKRILYGSGRYHKKGGIVEEACRVPGFFQLWHSEIIKIYPEFSPDAAYDDLTFFRFFAQRYNFKILKNLKCTDVSGETRKYWKGRKPI